VVKEIKPRLLLEKSKRGDGRGKLKLFLVFIVSFALGVFIGMRINNVNINETRLAKEKEIETNTSKTGVQGKKPSFLNDNPNLKESPTTEEEGSIHNKEDLSISTVYSSPASAGSKENNIANKESNESEPNKNINKTNEDEYKKHKYTLQVAAFKDSEMERAQAFVNKLKDKGYDAYIIPVYNSRGEAWNLVRVGKFKTKEEATDLAVLLHEKEGIETFVDEFDRESKD